MDIARCNGWIWHQGLTRRVTKGSGLPVGSSQSFESLYDLEDAARKLNLKPDDLWPADELSEEEQIISDVDNIPADKLRQALKDEIKVRFEIEDRVIELSKKYETISAKHCSFCMVRCTCSCSRW